MSSRPVLIARTPILRTALPVHTAFLPRRHRRQRRAGGSAAAAAQLGTDSGRRRKAVAAAAVNIDVGGSSELVGQHGKREVELIVFDWDGTVVDSITHITTSWRLAFTEWRVQAVREQLSRDEAPPAVPDDGWIKQCIGLSVDSTINKFMPNASTWDRYIITEGYRKHFRAGADKTTFFPGAEAGLRRLKQMGYTLAVATGKSRRGLDFELELLRTGDVFLATRTADCTKSKPHPQMLLEIMGEADTVAGRTLMVGDSAVDMRMASRAGVTGVGVTFGAEPRAALVATEPLHIVDDWDGLMAFFTTACAPYVR
mmetsp:Transcript_30941/g.78156  ORF Transcript_30941/g.78156 Transcript_30941/m.78156 type:complete len:313 (+) Transcript_30941:101-1039(+)